MVQIAKALGAKVVVGIDINRARLERSLNYGADFIPSTARARTSRRSKRNSIPYAKQAGVPKNVGWKIIECTGTAGRPGNRPGPFELSWAGWWWWDSACRPTDT